MKYKKKVIFSIVLALIAVCTVNAQLPCTFSENFVSPVAGTISGGSGTQILSYDDGNLFWNGQGAGGARNATFQLTNAVNFSDKLIIEFDWWFENLGGGGTSSGNEDEGQLRFRSGAAGTPVLFTLYSRRGDANGLNIAAGALGATTHAHTLAAAQRARIQAPAQRWYRVKIELYTAGTGQERRLAISVKGIDEDNENFLEHANVAIPATLTQTDIRSFYVYQYRTGGNTNWRFRMGNLCITNAATAPVVPAESVTMQSQYSIISVGGTSALAATVAPFDVTDMSLSWTVEPAGVATVTPDAKWWNATLTGVTPGMATVTATSATADVAGQIVVEITDQPILLTDVSISGGTEVAVNANITLSATTGPGNASNRNVVWSSEHPEIATVNASTGVVTGVSGGIATIKASAADGGPAFATHNVQVNFRYITDIDMRGPRRIFYPGTSTDNFNVTYVVSPADATQPAVVWSSTDESIVTVNQSGQVTHQSGYGKAAIVATSTDGSGVIGRYYIERAATNPYDVFSDFETSAAPFANSGRTSFHNSQVINWDISGQSGDRTQTFNLSNTIHGGVLHLRFDWFAGRVTSDYNTGSISLVDGSGGNHIFTVVYNCGDEESGIEQAQHGRFRYAVGQITPSGDNPPVGVRLFDIHRFDRWYTIEVTINFHEELIDFTITDRDAPEITETVNDISFANANDPNPRFWGFQMMGHRAATRNIGLRQCFDNFAYTIIDAGLPTYAVRSLTAYGSDKVAPGNKIMIYNRISPGNALNQNVTYEVDNDQIASLEVDAQGRALLTGLDVGVVTVTVRSVEDPEIFDTHVVSVEDLVIPNRQMELLDRGLVAVNTTGGVFMSWRLFGNDPENVRFNIYKNNESTPLNPEPLMPAYTNYTDAGGTEDDKYTVEVLIGSNPIYKCKTVGVLNQQYIRIPVVAPTTGTLNHSGNPYAASNYHINDASAADLDGDGQYEIIFLWSPNNLQDNSNSGQTGNVFIDAYKLDGTKLWGEGKYIDLGPNIRAGAHYNPFLVFDFDGDGKAEIIVKVADGTTDAQGTMIGEFRRYANPDGFVIEGPEYLAVFEGATGKLMDYTEYVPVRNDVRDWGDGIGNRADRFLAAVAYLDGVRPSAVMCRGYYTRSVLAAWDWDGKKLSQKWVFDSRDWGRQYQNQGYHSLSVGDVDGSGKDCIIYGSMTIKYDGTPLYNTNYLHGDALHVGKFDPDRPGLQVMGVHESPNPWGMRMTDAMTGDLIWGVRASGDIGRGVTASIDDSFRGTISWGAGGMAPRDAHGTQMSGSHSLAQNHLVYWTGTTGRELLDGSTPSVRSITRSGNPPSRTYSSSTVITFTGTSSSGGTKQNPALTADILGDWREEVIVRESNNSAIRIYTTTTPTVHTAGNAGRVPDSGIPTLMHDPTYRMAVAWQNGGYNQPPHTGFYLGYNMDDVPRIAGDVFTATFLPNGGTIDGSSDPKVLQSMTGAFIDIPYVEHSNPRYVLKGWAYEDDEVFIPRAISEDITLKAVWGIMYTLSFETNVPEFPNPEDKSVAWGEIIGLLPTPGVVTGYDFQWEYEGVVYTKETVFSETDDITLTAKWIPKEYILSFNTQTPDVVNPADQSVTFDAEVGTLPVVSRIGYDFDGWFLNNVEYTNLTVYTIANNATLVARWTAKVYTLSFDTQTADVSNPADQPVTFDAEVGLLPAVSRAGYDFDGWFLNDVEYTNATVYKIADNATLVAEWTVKVYSLSFDTQTADVSNPVDQPVTFNTEVGTLPVVSRAGYDFDGWFLNDVEYTNVTVYTLTDNATLVAEWTAKVYSLSFDTETADVPNPADKPVTFDAEVGTLPVVSRAGYEFDGWYLGDVLYTESTVYKVADDVTLVAKWSQLFIVTFDVEGGNGSLAATIDDVAIASDDEVAEGSNVVFTADPDPGYQVKVWTLNGVAVAGNTSNEYILEDLSENAEVTVEFELATYTVTFSVTGSNGGLTATVDGSGITTGAEVAYGKNVVFLAAPANNYRVKGWTLNGSPVSGNTTVNYQYNNLQAAITVSVEFEIIPPILNVPEFGSGELKLYPNPAHDIVTISGLEGGEIITLVDAAGRRMMQIKASNPLEEINVSNLARGMYLIIINDEAETTLRLVIE